MRTYGIRYECLRLRPHDHIGWVFSGQAEFAGLARPYLAEGAGRGERLMYVAADPERQPIGGLREVLGRDALQVASIAEVYGASGIVDADRQRATFEAALADALAAGYSGIRVAADNTPLVSDDQRLAAWLRWEIVADRMMSEKPVTGLCAFDQSQVDVDKLRHLSTLHPLSPAASPVPQFRMFSDTGNLCVEGEIDSSAISQLWLALDNLPAKTGIVVDLATATLMSGKALSGLRCIADAGVNVTVRGAAAAIGQLRIPAGLADERFSVTTA